MLAPLVLFEHAVVHHRGVEWLVGHALGLLLGQMLQLTYGASNTPRLFVWCAKGDSRLDAVRQTKGQDTQR